MLVAMTLSAAPAAADVTVTENSDVTASDGKCSLREAVAAAVAQTSTADCPGVAGSGTTTITLPAGAYAISSGPLAIGATGAVALAGAGQATTTIGPSGDRLVTVASGGALALSGVTLSGGRAASGADGGAISNAGTLTATDVAIEDSRAGDGAAGASGLAGGPGGGGGGLFNSGTATLTRVSFADVHAGAGGAGGAGAAAQTNVGNAGNGGNGGAGGHGGAVYSTGTLTAGDLTIAIATAGRGGAGADGGTATAPGDTGTGGAGGTGGVGGDGGAIYGSGTLHVDGATIGQGRSGLGGLGGDGGAAATAGGGDGGNGGAGGQAGAVTVTGAGVTLTGLRVTDARAASGGTGGDGGAAPSAPGDGGDGGNSGPGGAVVVRGGTAAITGMTLTGSGVDQGGSGGHPGAGAGTPAGGSGGDALGGGGLAVTGGQTTLTVSTISESYGGAGGDSLGGASGDGGPGAAIRATAALTATNVTLYSNTAGTVGSIINSGSPGATFGTPANGGGVWSSGAGTVSLRHVTAMYNFPDANATGGTFVGVDDVEASIIATGNATACVGVGAGAHNVAAPGATGCPGATFGDPALPGLADNGGPTKTLLPASTSAAVDVVPTSGCPAVDQRGLARPQGAACDAGAVEVALPPTCPPLTAAAPAPGASVTLTLACTEPTGAPLGYWIDEVPEHGTLEGVSETAVTYTPDPGFSGTDTFTYGAVSDLGGFSAPATATITVPAPPAGPGAPAGPSVRPTRVRVTPPARPAPAARPPVLPGIPLRPFGALTVKAKQKGAAVKGTLKLSYAGSRLDVVLSIRKTKKAKPVTIGTLTAKQLKAGTYAFTAKLSKRRGLPALKRSKSLKVAVRVTVTTPTGAKATTTKAITLTR
jgi:hypothetical protein